MLLVYFVNSATSNLRNQRRMKEVAQMTTRKSTTKGPRKPGTSPKK